jgi:hypothetical protein
MNASCEELLIEIRLLRSEVVSLRVENTKECTVKIASSLFGIILGSPKHEMLSIQKKSLCIGIEVDSRKLDRVEFASCYLNHRASR